MRRARRGKPPPRLRAVPLHRGDRVWTWVAVLRSDLRPHNPRPNPRPYPLCGGVPPVGGGVVSPRRARTYPSSKPPSLIFDI
ncbi:MAG: hypothetical protein LBM98_13320 [Oscillospiraceae bacterium]|nr:hypothetical protein [Oscillospiraceae bacterium]